MSLFIQIYSLTNPIDNSVFYVGATCWLRMRMECHRQRPSTETGKLLRRLGLKPIATVLEECDPNQATEIEKGWIEHYLGLGAKLENKRTSNSSYPDRKEDSYFFHWGGIRVRLMRNALGIFWTAYQDGEIYDGNVLPLSSYKEARENAEATLDLRDKFNCNED